MRKRNPSFYGVGDKKGGIKTVKKIGLIKWKIHRLEENLKNNIKYQYIRILYKIKVKSYEEYYQAVVEGCSYKLVSHFTDNWLKSQELI